MKMIDRTMSPLFANVVGTIITLGIFGFVLGVYGLIWGENPLTIYSRGASPLTMLVVSLVVFFISIVIHEGLHGIGYRLAGASWKEIKFGFLWKALMPYAHCRIPLRADAYRWAVALPGLILGLLPLIVSLVLHLDWLNLYAAAMLAGAVGDIMILGMLLPIQRDTLIQDHPTKPGFQILIP